MSELPSSSVCSVLGHELLSLSLELLSSLLLGILALHEFSIVIVELLGRDPLLSQLCSVSDKLSFVVTNPVDLVTDDDNNSENHEKGRDGEADAETDEICAFKFWLGCMAFIVHAEFISIALL